MPFSTITSFITIFLIAVFFITSADSATFVLGSQSTKGSLNPANKIKITWGLLMSATAAVLLYSGGLQALQNTMIVVAFPFSIIIVLMVISLLKALRQERLKEQVKERRLRRELVELRNFKNKHEREEKKRLKQEQKKQHKRAVPKSNHQKTKPPKKND